MRDAHRYEELAAHARDHGFTRVKRDAVQQWVKRGLVPRGEPHHYGQSRRTFTYPSRTGAQLLALCRLKFVEHVRALNEVAASLWLEGFDLPDDSVRRALTTSADLGAAERAGRRLAAKRGDTKASRRDAIDTFAEAATASRAAKTISPRARADATVGIADFVASALGVGDTEPDLAGMAGVANLTELGVRELERLLPTFSPEFVAARIAQASPAELRAVRAAARRGAAAFDPSALPPLARLSERRMAIVLAAGFLIQRDTEVFSAIVAAAEPEQQANSGAKALRYLT
jgi:hypothetical protein